MFVGIDAKPIVFEYLRFLVKKRFRSVIGCAIFVDDYERFKQEYSSVLANAVKSKINLNRDVLSSYEILDYTNGDYSILNNFYDTIKPHIKKINLFYTSFNSQRIERVKTQGKTRVPKEISVEELYDSHLDNAFPHLCAWKILQYLKSTKSKVFCDAFSTNPTNAWQELSQFEGFRIVPNGDCLNPLISTADIILKIIEERLSDRSVSLYPDKLKEIMNFENETKDNLYIHIFDNRDYPMITPLKSTRFEIEKYLQHPAHFIIKSKKSQIEMEFIKKHATKLMNQISESEGSLSFFDQRVHSSCLQDGDKLFYLDSTGKTTAQNIKKITGKKIRISDFNKIKG